MITFTGHGALAKAYTKVNRDCYIHSFRSMKDEEIQSVLKETTILVHNSAGLKDSDASANVDLTKRIIYQVMKSGKKIKFLYIGSMAYLNESGYLPYEQMTNYARSKFMGEIYAFCTLLQVRTIRFSTLFYGDPLRDGLSYMINDAVKNKKISLINDGLHHRDWLPLHIAAKELHRVITTPSPPVNTIASGQYHSFVELAKIVKKYTNCTIELHKQIVMRKNEVLFKFRKTVDVDIETEIKNYINQIKFN